LALPDSQDFPAAAAQLGSVSPISTYVPRSLLCPEFTICRRLDSAVSTPMHMPKATVYKYDPVQSNKDQIGSAWQILPVEPETEAQTVDDGTYHEFRFGILAPNSGHAAAALLWS
jgi:hypothetical protein